jgi:hypothetical protein
LDLKALLKSAKARTGGEVSFSLRVSKEDCWEYPGSNLAKTLFLN